MPMIHVTYFSDREDVKTILRNYRNTIRYTLSTLLKRPMKHIGLMPYPLSLDAQEFAENIFPLEIGVDVGDDPEAGLSDDLSNEFVKELVVSCPPLSKIRFGLWMRQFKSNGFTEYIPAEETNLSIVDKHMV